MMRVIGLDVHRTFAEVVYLEEGCCRSGGKVVLTAERLQVYAKQLKPTDEVVLEASANTAAIVRSLQPHVAQVIIANPLQVRAIAHARVKTDKIDAAVLAQLHASGFLPSVWMPDADTEALRRQVSRRAQLVRQRTRLKKRGAFRTSRASDSAVSICGSVREEGSRVACRTAVAS